MPGRSAAEWTTLALSAAVVATLVGVALVEHFLLDEPPGVRVAVSVAEGAAERRDGVYYVPFEATNRGGEPAADVTIEFEVRRGGEVLETSSATVPFLPIGGSAGGEIATELDPAAHEVVGRVGNLLAP